MSTPRRLFEDPRNTYIVENDDPDAFDKRFAGRPGVHREQRCCRDRAPVWQPHLIHDDENPGGRNRPAYRQESYGIEVQDATGESDNVTGENRTRGYVWVQGPNSGYKPDFISAEEWMRWQSVYWIPAPRGVPANMPNPPRWVRMPGERKIREAYEGRFEYLWCQKCETALESAWSDILEVLPIAARGVAMIASYVPVYGTALSMAINTTVSLAEGESIDQSILDGIGGALPCQPTSGMVFNAGVAIGKGERVEHVAIDSLPVDKSVKVVLKAAADIIYTVASGQNVTDAAYDSLHQILPPEAQQGMDYARRVIRGENVPEMILSEAEQITMNSVRDSAQSILENARRKGPDALSAAEAEVNSMFNQYAAEFGYQMAFDRLPSDERSWVQLGLAGGGAMSGRQQFVGTFGWIPERNIAVNDGYEAQGKALIASGIIYKTKPVGDILTQNRFKIVIDFYDSLNSVWTKREMEYSISDDWRRGFTVAIGACQGRSERGPGQLGIYQSLAEGDMRGGFDAGQAVQYNRTLYGDRGLPFADLVRGGHSPYAQARAEANEELGISDRAEAGNSPFQQARNENPSQ